MVEVLTFIFWLFASFTVCHYSLSRVIRNEPAVSLFSLAFAILFTVFVGGLIR